MRRQRESTEMGYSRSKYQSWSTKYINDEAHKLRQMEKETERKTETYKRLSGGLATHKDRYRIRAMESLGHVAVDATRKRLSAAKGWIGAGRERRRESEKSQVAKLQWTGFTSDRGNVEGTGLRPSPSFPPIIYVELQVGHTMNHPREFLL